MDSNDDSPVGLKPLNFFGTTKLVEARRRKNRRKKKKEEHVIQRRKSSLTSLSHLLSELPSRKDSSGSFGKLDLLSSSDHQSKVPVSQRLQAHTPPARHQGGGGGYHQGGGGRRQPPPVFQDVPIVFIAVCVLGFLLFLFHSTHLVFFTGGNYVAWNGAFDKDNSGYMQVAFYITETCMVLWFFGFAAGMCLSSLPLVPLAALLVLLCDFGLVMLRILDASAVGGHLNDREGGGEGPDIDRNVFNFVHKVIYFIIVDFCATLAFALLAAYYAFNELK